MNDRQVFLDRVRELTKELEAELVKPKIFTKEVEPFMLKEAVINLEIAEKYLNGYLQVDKYNGN